jgi:hypothetical protein
MKAHRFTRPIFGCSVVVSLLLSQPAWSDQAPLVRVQIINLKGPNSRLDHLALDANHKRLFVANMANASLDIVDLTEDRLVKQISGQKGIQGIAYSPDLNRIFVGVGEDGVCNIFDGASYRLLKSIPLPDADNVRYEPRTGRVYVGHAEKALAVIDARSLELLADIKLPAPPESFQLGKERPLIYLNTPRPSQVVVIDREKNTVLKSYPLTAAHENFPMALDEANHRILIGCRRRPMLVVLDSGSGKEVAQVDIPGDTDDLFLDAKRNRIYVSCGEGFLAVIRQIDADHYELEAKLQRSGSPGLRFLTPVRAVFT